MGTDERLITIAVHTCEKAIEMKSMLQREGIEATLQNINLEHPVISSGMRVRIKESDLARALLVVEADSSEKSESGNIISRKEVLVPIDFSDYSFNACKAAFKIAAHHNASVKLINAFLAQGGTTSTQLQAVLNYDGTSTNNSNDALHKAEFMMTSFVDKINDSIKLGKMDAVSFSTLISEGIPEEVILQYVRENSPLLIVMGTRGADKKGKELVGSVTAEVLDSCRRPVISIPEGSNTGHMNYLGEVLFFCNGEQTDILAFDNMLHIITDGVLHVTLALLQTKRRETKIDNVKSLCDYCVNHYPHIKFSTVTVDIKNCDAITSELSENGKPQLIAVPSKRRSAFSRLFNPGIAHRILFSADIPVMSIPV